MSSSLWRSLTPLAVSLLLASCDRSVPTEVHRPGFADHPAHDAVPTHGDAQELRAHAAQHGIVALPRPAAVRPELVRLGQALSFDPLISGNKNISCMTCHLPAFATGDAKNLSIGEGGTGLGPTRQLGTGVFIPRNAPPLFNLTALQTLFWDGRVSRDPDGTFHTPANTQLSPDMTRVFEFGAISALGLFPVTSRTEMRGFVPRVQTGTIGTRNELALIDDSDFVGIWAAIMKRLGNIPEYRAMFEAAYPGVPFNSMTFAHASNAMAGFFVDQLSFDNSPWDRFLAGDDGALTTQQVAGGKAFMLNKCAACHNGPAFTDGKARNVALAQFGPGEGNGPGGRDDFGRFNVTGLATDKYLFRTTPLRNVELTGPYGHAGEFATLRGFVDHYSESDTKLLNYDVSQIDPLLRGTLLQNQADILATRSGALDKFVLTPEQIDDITAYLLALTDPAARQLKGITPSRVPSGLPVVGISFTPIPGGLPR